MTRKFTTFAAALAIGAFAALPVLAQTAPSSTTAPVSSPTTPGRPCSH